MAPNRDAASPLALALLMIGCAAGEPGLDEPPPADRTWEGDFLLDEVVIDCDAGGWTYDVRTRGWGEEVVVQVVVREYGVLLWQEVHPLPEVDHGDDWARFSLELGQARYESHMDGRTTAVPCELKTFVTYGFSAWTYEGELSECMAWGLEPAELFPDCANWGEVDH